MTRNQSISSWNDKSLRQIYPLKKIDVGYHQNKTPPANCQLEFSESRYPVLHSQNVRIEYFWADISEPSSRESAALRANSQLQKGRSPPRFLQPLGSEGTVSALRLVTCRSPDALRLSSSGRMGRKSQTKASRYASS